MPKNKFFDFFKKKEEKSLIKKFSSNPQFFEIDPSTFRSNNHEASFFRKTSLIDFIGFYLNISTVFSAVERKAREIQSIVPKVFDTKNSEFLDDHPILDLLNKPNPIDTRQTFIGNLQRFFDVTGNAFYTATGRLNNPPLELFVHNPTQVNILPVNHQNTFFSKEIRLIHHQHVETFHNLDPRKEIGKINRLGEMRMVNPEMTKEIFHYRTFNPLSSLGSFGDEDFGISKLNAIKAELEQYILLNLQNKNILKRGSIPPIWLLPANLPSEDKIILNWKKEIQAYLSGEGAALVMEGLTKEEIFESTQKLLDMNFGDLKKNITEIVYRHYDIPLALVLPEQMTLANMEAATLNLYDNAILPDTKMLFQKLTKDLMPRFENSEGLELRFSTTDIPALRIRAISEIERLSKAFILTPNELRKELGLGPVEDGDNILIPQNLIPMLRDIFTGDSLSKPLPRSKKIKLLELLKTQSMSNGKPLISEDEANKLAEEYYEM